MYCLLMLFFNLLRASNNLNETLCGVLERTINQFANALWTWNILFSKQRDSQLNECKRSERRWVNYIQNKVKEEYGNGMPIIQFKRFKKARLFSLVKKGDKEWKGKIKEENKMKWIAHFFIERWCSEYFQFEKNQNLSNHFLSTKSSQRMTANGFSLLSLQENLFWRDKRSKRINS